MVGTSSAPKTMVPAPVEPTGEILKIFIAEFLYKFENEPVGLPTRVGSKRIIAKSSTERGTKVSYPL